MKPLLRTLLFLLLTSSVTQAQTKVFNEVADSISSQLQLIRQDNNLVGYLMFTQLERVSADSFNYRLSIMDENLNDIGTVNFHEEKLFLKSVAFEQDILCLVYVRSNFAGKEFRSSKQFRREKDNAKTDLFAQFVDLHGKIVNRYTMKMDVRPDVQQEYSGRKVIGNGRLKQQIQLCNISGKGFACFYGDDSKNSLLVFNAGGKLTWQKTVKEDGTNFLMLASGPEVSLLLKKKEKMQEGGFEIVSYNTSDSTTYPKFLLKDRKGNSLKVLAFENDPVTGKPYVSGLIIDPVKGNRNLGSLRGLKHGNYCGIFSISLNGHHRNDIQPSFTYWMDASLNKVVDRHGYYEEARAWPNIETAFRDYQGNTWFAGSGFHGSWRVGNIIGSVLLLPTLYGSIACIPGIKKYCSDNVLLIKQDAKGHMSLESTITASRTRMQGPSWSPNSDRSFYTVTNSDMKCNYLVIDDTKNIFIYNVNQKKVARTIARKDGNSYVALFPAKEGHVMVSEYDQKKKQTRLSIEAL